MGNLQKTGSVRWFFGLRNSNWRYCQSLHWVKIFNSVSANKKIIGQTQIFCGFPIQTYRNDNLDYLWILWKKKQHFWHTLMGLVSEDIWIYDPGPANEIALSNLFQLEQLALCFSVYTCIFLRSCKVGSYELISVCQFALPQAPSSWLSGANVRLILPCHDVMMCHNKSRDHEGSWILMWTPNHDRSRLQTNATLWAIPI